MLEEYKNKIICGDCLEVMKGIPDNCVDCIITSPPYNKHSANRKCGKNDSWQRANIIYGDFKDDLPEKKYQEQQKKLIREMVRVLKKNGSIFYNHKVRIVKHRAIIPTEWLSEFNIRQVLIWDRTNTPQFSPIRWLPTTEYIYWISKGQVQPKFYKRSKHQHEIIKIPPKPMKEHPAPFPEELVKTLMLNTTDENDIVLDPYIGSGTTAVVCQNLHRNFIGIEISPEYCKIAEQRLRQKTLI
jgi:site-specific DNA-methyltransferase (adenine-specific)